MRSASLGQRQRRNIAVLLQPITDKTRAGEDGTEKKVQAFGTCSKHDIFAVIQEIAGLSILLRQGPHSRDP